MSKYNWHRMLKKPAGPKGKRSKSIYLSEAGMLTISKEFDDEMEQPEFVNMYYDLENKLLAFAIPYQEDSESYKISRHPSRGSAAITCKYLSAFMPTGRYLVEEERDSGDKIVLRWVVN